MEIAKSNSINNNQSRTIKKGMSCEKMLNLEYFKTSELSILIFFLKHCLTMYTARAELIFWTPFDKPMWNHCHP